MTREWGHKIPNKHDIPIQEVDWGDHGKPHLHANPHVHVFDPITGERRDGVPFDPNHPSVK